MNIALSNVVTTHSRWRNDELRLWVVIVACSALIRDQVRGWEMTEWVWFGAGVTTVLVGLTVLWRMAVKYGPLVFKEWRSYRAIKKVLFEQAKQIDQQQKTIISIEERLSELKGNLDLLSTRVQPPLNNALDPEGEVPRWNRVFPNAGRGLRPRGLLSDELDD